MKRWIESNKWPLAIFAAAFFIRLVYLIEISFNNPAFYHPMVDELWNLNWAREIIDKSLWGQEAYFRGPLYPYLLALLLKVSGGSIFFARFVQALIASGSVVLVYLIGKKLLSHRIGLLAAAFYTVYGTLMLYEAMLLIPVIFIFLNLLGFYQLILLHGTYNIRRWLLIGIIFGLAAVARPNILLLIPIFMIWAYYGFKPTFELKKRLITPLILLVGALIPVFAVSARNIAVTGEFILISSQGGVNFYIGNNPDTEGLTMLMPEVQLDEALPWSEFTAATRRAAEAEVGHSLSASQESAFWTGKAVDFILNNPGQFIGITFKKLVYFFVGFENSDQTDIYQARDYSLLYSVFLWKNILYCPFGIILPLAGAGIALLWSKRKELLLLYLFILGYLPTVILFLVTARHRLPVIPFLIILAAGAVFKTYEYIKKKKNNRLAVPAIILVVLLIFGNKTYFDIGFENEFQTHFNLALTYSRQGNSGAAEEEYRRALELNPYSATTLNNLGFLIYQQGRVQEALTLYERAIQVDPDFAESYNNTGLVYENRRDYVGAEQYYREALKRDSRLYQAHINLGDIYLAQAKMEKAEEAYTDAYEAAPDEKSTHFKLAAFYARMQQYARAEQFFLQGKQLGEPSAFDFVNWGNIYFATDRPRQAIEKYHSAILLNPHFVQGYFNLALTFERYQLSRDSVRFYLNKLLQIDPDYTKAQELLQRIQ